MAYHSFINITQWHYELQSYENLMKMSLKNQESIFQGTEYGDVIFMVYLHAMNFL